MDIYLKKKMAYVDFAKGYMLCIGTKEEVDNASNEQILRMIWEAIALAQFNSITDSRCRRVH
jgi:hypothetical protein